MPTATALDVAAPSVTHEPERLTALLEALPAAAVLFAANGATVAVNQRGRALLVIDALAPLASQPAAVVLQPLGEVVQRAMDAARRGEPTHTHTVLLDHHGMVVDVRVTPFDGDRLLVAVVDVTEREQRRAALDRAESDLAALLALTPASVRLVDVGGRIRAQNAVAAREHAEHPAATVRELWERDAPHEVAHERPLTFLDTPAMKAFAGLAANGQLLEVRRHGAVRTIEAYAAPLRSATGDVTGVVLVDLDVSEREQLRRLAQPAVAPPAALGAVAPPLDAEAIERLVEARSRDMIAAQEDSVRERRLAAIGQLAAGVMHDLNNALNPIMAAAYLLRHHAESPDAVRDYADRITMAADIGAATASRVGRFIRQEPLHAGGDEATDLTVLAQEVLDLTAPLRQRLVGQPGEVHLVRVLADHVGTRGLPGEIREALLNLVQNAMDAMPTGGTLTVRTWAEGRDACVAVQDTGVGMTADVRERAFEPFFSTKGRKGSGLGLAEVYGIVRRHRGTVTICSEPGRGTEVLMRLPLDAASVTPVVPAPVPVTTPQRILVVEDHDDGREFLRRILRGDGHEVEAVGTCADARRCLESGSPPPYDLVLTDVGLPDGSGWDLVQHIHTVAPSLRVGVLTGWEPNADAAAAHGAEFVLRKPLRATELKAHIAGRHSPSITSE